jgi:aminopeptidase N
VKIISQIPERITTETFENPIKVRQAIARHVSKIPVELKVDYESLLHDQSYATIESALYNLWINFPEDRVMYLDQTKDVQGFNDKNVRTLWLALALVTPDYEQEKKELFFRELLGYTNPKYSFQLRQNAFQYLTMVQACDTRCKENLREATTHHNWRMVKFAKELLKQLN